MTLHSAAGRLIRQLLAERGIRSYELFLLQQEGKELPEGIESVSGFVIDGRRRVHGFWLDYDAATRRYVLDPFYEVGEPEQQFADDPEFRQAVSRLAPREPRL